MRHRLNLPRLAQILAESRVSQNHWALRLGFSRGHWSDIVNGRHPYPSAKTRERMVEVFEVSDLFIPEPGHRNVDVDFRIAISGRYELTSELGHGGMGTVYLANDLALGRLVALKVVAAEAAAGVGADQLLKEIAHTCRLQHPNILPVFDAGTGAGSPYYVMPYVRAGSLGALIRDAGRLPLGQVVGLVREIAAGLGHSHAHRVLHCDIKPENILVDGAHPYVMDFGIARKLHTEADEWSALRKELDFSAGTPAYVSPEQASGERDIDARSDVYSLACVVYEMLTGNPPFTGSNTQQIVTMRFREPAPPLRQFAPDVPPAVARAIELAMSLDPDKRPPTASAFSDELTHGAAEASAVRTGIAIGASRARRWVARQTVGVERRPRRAGPVARLGQALRQDLTCGFRQRRRAPGLTMVALLTLALTIGLTTAVSAIIYGVMLRPLPFPAPERIVALESVDSTGGAISTVSTSNWLDWQAGSRSFDATALYTHAGRARSSVVVGDNALRVPSATVTSGFFRVLGARFVRGRDFDSTAVAAGAGGGGAIVSEAFWRRELAGSSDSSRSILVNGEPSAVIGVVAEGQEFPAGTEVWTAFQPRMQGGGARNNINWLAIGRLSPGTSIEQAQAELGVIARRIRQSTPQALYSHGVHVEPLRTQLVGDTTSLLLLLGSSVAIVMLIGCANLASANLAQGAQRMREMAVRTALGAGRTRLVRQVLVENIALALVGGAAGVALAWALVRSAIIIGAGELPRVTAIVIDARVLLIAFVISALAGILTGVLPALQASRATPNDVLGGGTRGAVAGGRGMPGRVLVVAEIAMALMLVTGAGLLVRSMSEVLARPLGFQTDNVLAATVTLGGPRYQQDSTAFFAYWRELARRLRSLPGVRHAGLTNDVPLVNGGTGFVEIDGKDVPDAAAGYRMISEGYLEALGIPLRAGRAFGAGDRAGSPRVAIINRRMADTFWPGESPLGRRVRATSMEGFIAEDGPPWITVIGVVTDVRHYGYEDDPDPAMFVLYRQLPSWRIGTLTAIVRGSGSDEALARSVREAIASVDAAVPADYEFLATAAERITAPRRFAMQVLQVFGGLALLLAGIGVYGVLAFSVAQRTRELAVRSALGADRARLLRLVMGSGAAVVTAGLAIGIAGALASGRVIEAMLFGVGARDPVVLGAATALIATIGALAAIIPAHRATRIDAMAVLRNE